MFKLTFFNEDHQKTVKKFKTRDEALAYAKKKWFNPEDDWYADGEELGIVEDYEVDSIEKVAEIDFNEFKEKGKFNFNDGRHIVASLHLEEI